MLYEAIFRHVAVQARHVSDNRHYVLFAQTRAIRARVRIRAGEAPSDRVGLLRESPPSLITARPFRAATEWPRYTPPLVFAPYDRVHGACSRTASPAPAQVLYGLASNAPTFRAGVGRCYDTNGFVHPRGSGPEIVENLGKTRVFLWKTSTFSTAPLFTPST